MSTHFLPYSSWRLGAEQSLLWYRHWLLLMRMGSGETISLLPPTLSAEIAAIYEAHISTVLHCKNCHGYYSPNPTIPYDYNTTYWNGYYHRYGYRYRGSLRQLSLLSWIQLWCNSHPPPAQGHSSYSSCCCHLAQTTTTATITSDQNCDDHCCHSCYSVAKAICCTEHVSHDCSCLYLLLPHY